jgi:hypothetical protein
MGSCNAEATSEEELRSFIGSFHIKWSVEGMWDPGGVRVGPVCKTCEVFLLIL